MDIRGWVPLQTNCTWMPLGPAAGQSVVVAIRHQTQLAVGQQQGRGWNIDLVEPVPVPLKQVGGEGCGAGGSE